MDGGYMRAMVVLKYVTYCRLQVCLIYQSFSIALASISVFLPTIVKTLGYANAEAHLMTVPPYACACVTMLVAAYISDRIKLRGPFVAGGLILSGIGYTIL